MITSFRHKGLQELFVDGETRRLPQERLRKISRLLRLLECADKLIDINQPGLRFHRLKMPPLEGYYSIDVSGNYRLVFQFEHGNASNVDFLDTH